MSAKRNPWPYLILRMVAITIILTPLLTGIFKAFVNMVYEFFVSANATVDDVSKDIYFGWGYTLFYFTWSFFLFVLLSYNLIYFYSELREQSLIKKLLLFYGLQVLMGFLLPYASLVDLYPAGGYPGVLLLYLLLTLTLCPLSNLALNRILPKREAYTFNEMH